MKKKYEENVDSEETEEETTTTSVDLKGKGKLVVEYFDDDNYNEDGFKTYI
jgi:hypothetical protein